jgi:hypothetical protein
MYEERKKALAARAKEIKARLDQIKGRADFSNRDLSFSERREVDELKTEAQRLHNRVKDIQADEELDKTIMDLGNGIHKGKESAPRTNVAQFAFKEADIKTLHDAARRRVPMKLISRDESPMSNRIEYSLPPFTWAHDTFRLLDYLPTEQTTSGRINWFSQNQAATGSAPVEEGALKPQSFPEWTELECKVEKIAHYAKATDEVLADFGEFLNLLSEELIKGLDPH